jgi:hypothetical protein
MHSLGSVIESTKALKPPKSAAKTPISVLDWEAAVGSRIAERAEPHRLERGVLTVRVSSASWANELSLLSPEILTQLRERGFAIDQLRFSVGQVRPHKPRRLSPPKKAPPANPPLPDTVKAQVAAVDDDELAQALADAAAKTLAVRGRSR